MRSEYDDRFLADDVLREKVDDSKNIDDLDMADYDIVFPAGGWGGRDRPAGNGALGGRRRNLVTGQNQNAGPMVARELMRLAESTQP